MGMVMTDPEISIRTMSPAEVDLAIEWAVREAWNPGLEDAACFRAADPEGFLMAFVDGEPAASLSTVRYGETFGFIGLYIAAPPHRGRGIALRLWLARKQTRRSWILVEPNVETGGGPRRVTGHGTVRRCRAGWKIGPLFADDAARADLLFRRLAADAGTAPIILDLPEPNRAALDLAKAYNLSPIFETARMCRGAAPLLPIDRMYGITTFELG
jgi:hypothetical protein